VASSDRNKRQRQSIGVRSLPIILQAIIQSLFALLINLLPFLPGQLRQRVEELRTIGEIINGNSDARPRHRRICFAVAAIATVVLITPIRSKASDQEVTNYMCPVTLVRFASASVFILLNSYFLPALTRFGPVRWILNTIFRRV